MTELSQGEDQRQDLMSFLSTISGDKSGEDLEEAQVEYVQVIGLELADELFIIDILNVREIVRFEELEITRVPHGHYYVLGVINLRGKVVPVVDLGMRLELEVGKRDQRARLVVIEIEERLIGFTVDAVSEVLRLPKGSIEPAEREDYVLGVAMVEGQIMTMLDPAVLFVEAETEEV